MLLPNPRVGSRLLSINEMRIVRTYQQEVSFRHYLQIPTQFFPPIAITAPPLYSKIDCTKGNKWEEVENRDTSVLIDQITASAKRILDSPFLKIKYVSIHETLILFRAAYPMKLKDTNSKLANLESNCGSKTL